MTARFRIALAAAVAIFCAAFIGSPARADSISGFDVNGTFNTGASLSGVLTIDITTGSVLDASLNLSAGTSGCGVFSCTAETFNSIFEQLGSLALILQNPSQNNYLGLIFPSTSFTNYQGGPVDSIDINLTNWTGALMLSGNVSASPVPEPATALLLLGGLGLLGFKSRKRLSRPNAA